VIAAFPGIKEVNVYGVHVPGTEGAVGMAAIVTEGEMDLPAFRAYLASRLPGYARPQFVRHTSGIKATATFKHIKQDLAREGYDPAVTGDPIHFDHPGHEVFVRVDGRLYSHIQTGKVRV
jgi:fatty-acyl-CoA synthase